MLSNRSECSCRSDHLGLAGSSCATTYFMSTMKTFTWCVLPSPVQLQSETEKRRLMNESVTAMGGEPVPWLGFVRNI